MTKKATLVVVTPVGTFKRSTARTYTHLVVVGPKRAEWLEEKRVAKIASRRKSVAKHEAAIADNGAAELAAERARVIRNGLAVVDADKWIAQIAYIHEAPAQIEYRDAALAEIATLEAKGTITADEGAPEVLGWCGRLDLARKLANTEQATPHRFVHIYEVATGAEVK